MKRGEVWWINFDPSIGGEIKKIRPAVILSMDTSNKYLNRLQVIPLSTQVTKCYPCEAIVDINSVKHKVLTDQIMTVSKKRCSEKFGVLNQHDLLNIERALKIQLGIV